MANIVNAVENDSPVVALFGATTNLNKIKDNPDIVCCNILFKEEIVARVSSSAWLCMWLIFAIAKASWNPMPMHTKIKLNVDIFGSLK